MGQFGSKGGLSRIVAKDESNSSRLDLPFYFRRVVLDSKSGEFRPCPQVGLTQDVVRPPAPTQRIFALTTEPYLADVDDPSDHLSDE